MSTVDCWNTGDTAFMMFATTVVMLQTPAMGFAQAGMIRRKNALSMLMQTMSGMVIGSVLFFMFGYSLTFGPTQGGFIGNFEYFFLQNIDLNGCPDGLTIPNMVFIAFQMMFALMTPVIVTGAWAEKMTFPAFLVFITLWPILVYYPIAHWIWGAGGWLFEEGVVDFAGGAVIHTAAGTAALVVSAMMARRSAVSTSLSHHNFPLTVIGASLIWSGWYSFNGGSAFAANDQAATALMNTHMSACVSAMCWVLIGYLHDRKWRLSEVLNGAFAGLAAITPGSGFVSPAGAFAIGVVVGSISWFSARFVKNRLKLDDVLDVSSLQGTPGFLGMIFVGFFAVPDVGGKTGVFYDSSDDDARKFLGWQTAAAVCAMVWSGVMTFLLVLLMKHTVGINVPHDTEEKGLDLVQIGEQAYDDKLRDLLDLGHDVLTVKLCEAASMGDLPEVTSLIRAGAEPNRPDYDGRTPAHLAASEGRLTILRHLHRAHHVDLNATDKFGNTPLTDALQSRRMNTVRFLVKSGCKLNPNAVIADLFDVCSTGDTSRLSDFIVAGVDVNCQDYDMRTPLMVASSDGQVKIVRQLLEAGAKVDVEDRWGHTAMGSAEQGGHDSVVSLLANAGAETSVKHPLLARNDKLAGGDAKLVDDVDGDHEATKRNEYTASTREMCNAAGEGALAIVKALVTKGADVNQSDYDGRTPMHLASAGGHLRVMQYLHSRGANINAMDRWKQTALHEAKRHNHDHIAIWLQNHGAVSVNKSIGFDVCSRAARNDLDGLQALVKSGVDVTVADYDGRTGVHLAAAEGHVKVLQFLLSRGANHNATDRFGGTPLSDAMRSKHQNIVDLLHEKGADGEVHPMNGNGTHVAVVNGDADAGAGAGDDAERQLLLQV